MKRIFLFVCAAIVLSGQLHAMKHELSLDEKRKVLIDRLYGWIKVFEICLNSKDEKALGAKFTIEKLYKEKYSQIWASQGIKECPQAKDFIGLMDSIVINDQYRIYQEEKRKEEEMMYNVKKSKVIDTANSLWGFLQD